MLNSARVSRLLGLNWYCTYVLCMYFVMENLLYMTLVHVLLYRLCYHSNGI